MVKNTISHQTQATHLYTGVTSVKRTNSGVYKPKTVTNTALEDIIRYSQKRSLSDKINKKEIYYYNIFLKIKIY